MCFTLSAALGDHGPITHMGTGSPGSAPDGEAGSEAPTRGDCVVRDPHPDTRLGGGLQSVPGGGGSFLGKPGQLGPLTRTALPPGGKVGGNIGWRCPLKSSNLGTIKGCFRNEEIIDSSGVGRWVLPGGRRAGPLPLEGKSCGAQGQRCPPGGAGPGVVRNMEVPAEAPAWGWPVFPNHSFLVPGLRMQIGSPSPSSSSFSPNKGSA